MVENWRILVVGSDGQFQNEWLESPRLLSCREVSRGAAALETIDDTDCLIIRAPLKDMEVLELLAALRDGDLPRCPVVVIAAPEGHPAARELLRAGATEHLNPRTLTRETLLDAIDNAIHRHAWLTERECRHECSNRAERFETESTLRSFYESSEFLMGVVELPDDDSDIIHVYDNPATQAFLDVSRGSDPCPTTNEMGMAAATRDLWISHYRESQRGGQPVRFEYRHPSPDVTRWLSCVVAYIGLASCGRARFSYLSHDITQRVAIEAQQREGQAHLALTLQAGQLGFWDWNIATGHVHFGGSWEKMLGYEFGELAPHVRIWKQLIHPDDAEPISRILADHLESRTEYYEAEHRLRHKDGSWRWILTRGQVVQRDAAGTALRALGTHADITERKHSEERLRDSESFYRQILESIPGMTFTCTPAGDCDFISQQWIEFTGVPMEQQLGSGWAQLLHPDDRERTVAAWRAAVENRGSYDLEYRVHAHSGNYEWFKVRGRAIRDSSGKIVRWFGAAVNVDDLVRAEEALREADQRKDEFLAMLAHELRNPLAPILNAVEILRLTKDTRPGLDGIHEVVERQVRHLVHLVDDLLDVSRVSSGKIQLRCAPVDLLDVVEQAIEMHRPVITARQHEFTYDVPNHPVPINGDAVRLAQVVGNLLNNAAKYSDPGGHIQLNLTVEGPSSSPSAVLRIRDRGRGIDPAALQHLFDLFYQADRTIDRSEGGLGLGLSLVKSLVLMHGGSVEAHSAGRGHGSEFIVRLPTTPT